MSKLISMTDYVMTFENEYPCADEKDYHNTNETVLCKIIKYADFLKQPLTLGMFIPCDDEGNVLNEMYSEKENTKNKTFTQLSNEYQQVKERVIFEGITTKKGKAYHLTELYFDKNYLFTYNSSTVNFLIVGSTIENLIELNLTLTETTAKKLGL